MADKLILAIDFGTQSVRASLFNKKGDLIAIEKNPYNPPYFSKQVGYAEQEPSFYFENLCDVTKRLISNNQDKINCIEGLTLTCFRDTPVFLDKDLKVIRPSILWLDQRQAKLKEKIPFLYSLIFGIVGMSETVKLNRKRTPAQWLKENEPENWAKVYKYVPLSTYMIYLLTGELKDSASNQTGHYPINYRKKQFYKSDLALKGCIFGIKKSMLCEIIPNSSYIGSISEEVSKITGLPTGLKVYASGSDKGCETLGLGCIDNNVAAISYGTASTVSISTKSYHEPSAFLPSYPACFDGYYNMEYQVYRGYWMLTWFMKEFANKGTIEDVIQNELQIEDMNKKMMQISPGCDGLVLQPYWGPGLKRPLAKGAVIGFSDVHTREHLYRAIIEGIAYDLRDGLESFQKKTHRRVKEIRISGGGSKSDAICQITADIFGIPVTKVQTYETSSLGAAMNGFIAIGEYKDAREAINNMVRKSITFSPNKEAHEQYNYLFKHAYLKVYPKLKNVYKDIKEYGQNK